MRLGIKAKKPKKPPPKPPTENDHLTPAAVCDTVLIFKGHAGGNEDEKLSKTEKAFRQRVLSKHQNIKGVP